MSMATIEHVRLFKAVSESAKSVMESFLAMAEQWAIGIIGCDLSAATVTERLSGDGSLILYTSRWPVTAVTSVELEQVGLTLTTMTDASAEADQDVYLPPHGLWIALRPIWQGTQGLIGWPEGVSNVKVVYTSGYSAALMPADVTGAIAQMTWLLWQERDRLGDGSLSVGDRSVSQVVRDIKEYPFLAATLRRHGRPYLG